MLLPLEASGFRGIVFLGFRGIVLYIYIYIYICMYVCMYIYISGVI